MDSRDDSKDSIPSSLTTAKVKTLKMIAAAALKTRFYENYCRRQPFSFPDSIMHYIAKNPSTSKCYEKMVKSRKYFFVKNQAFVINDLWYNSGKGKWENLIGYESFTLDLDNIGCKLWIAERVRIYPNSSATDMQNLVSPIASKIYRCDAKWLDINNQIISYKDYCLLSRCAEMISFHNVIVKNEDGSITPFEKLIEAAPELKYATFTSDTILSNITSNTVQELIKLPNFSKIETLKLRQIPEIFDLDAFYIYMKANNFTSFDLFFVDTISEAYKNRLEEIIDEIIEADQNEKIDFMTPYIYFNGIDPEKYDKLYEIYCAC